MSKIRLEDFYEDDDDNMELSARVHTKKHKNQMREMDDVFAKKNKKAKTCKMKRNRREKDEEF